jgi:hypothetical protein
MAVSYRVELSGPLLKGDSSRAKEAVEEAVKDLVIEGERAVKLDLFPGHGLVTGHYRNSIHGEITNSLHGVIDDSKVVYGSWLEGVSSRNDKTRFKGYAMFRKAHDKLERMAGEILQHAVERLVKRLD